MPLYRNGDKVILFVHIPKTGGSTVEEVLKAAGAPQALKYHKRLGYSNATPQHMHWEVLKHWLPAGFYDYAFAVVRHPMARMVSEYRWRRVLTKTRELPDFDTWVRRQLKRYGEDSFILDNHIRPQGEFIGARVEVFRLEDGLESPVRAGLEHLGLDTEALEIHHARKSERDTLSATEQTLQRIRKFYAADFERFGYDPEQLPKDLQISSPA
ncbi:MULTISPECIES: sulfotransferase family 2 domain-containing protein [unclassified Leisingera]|nr:MULTISPECIES: sulfotransferase family 2 domain-containing protein [unclassified Leisingera]